jgi:tRNA modification GTPase
MSTHHASTIYALASAAGKAGVAVFRISGPQAREALEGLGVTKTLAPRVASLVSLKTPEGAALDQALALFFPAPYSFTGEDVVELHTHGSRAVTRMLLDALNKVPNLRLAEPGEFARRAFLAGKLDLLEAEGLADLIDAETRAQHAQALRQLGGDATQRVEALRHAILEPLALLEAYIDFPDEEIPESVLATTTQRVEALQKELAEMLDDRGVGEKIRDGLEIVILGAPNAGKSSLLNALARREAAIVSPEAGTTRDLIEVPMEIAGHAVTLVDTAGLREAENRVEAEGIRRARARAENADLTLLVLDATSPSDAAPLTSANLIILNKTDLAPDAAYQGALRVSATTGAGLDALIAALAEHVSAVMDTRTPPLITRARHRGALREAAAALARFCIGSPLELNCEELRLAARAISKITGKIAVDDVLDLVFSRFCIGK